MSSERFEALFGETTDVVCAFHGYARALHQLLHGRPNAGRFHVHGYSEQGTTTTPFDMVVLNECSRYHLVLNALRRARRIAPGARALERHCEAMLDAPPRLHPRALRGHARGARLDVAGRTAERRPRVRVLVVNAGSSSLKHALVDARTLTRPRAAARSAGSPDGGAGRHAARAARRRSPTPAVDADAVGHRVVHGGARFTGPGAIDAGRARRRSRRWRRSRRCTPAPRWRASTRRPRRCRDLPQVACFDTAFHRTTPAGGRDVRAAARVDASASGCAASAFTGSTSQWCHEQARGALGARRAAAGSSSATSAAAARSPPCSTAARSTPRWASRRWRACRWRRARARSTPACCCTCSPRGIGARGARRRAQPPLRPARALRAATALREVEQAAVGGRRARAARVRRARARRQLGGRRDDDVAARPRRARLHGRRRRALGAAARRTSARGWRSSASRSTRTQRRARRADLARRRSRRGARRAGRRGARHRARDRGAARRLAVRLRSRA